jgi:hypothetical protein
MWMIAAACLLPPLMYYIFYVYRRNLKQLAVLTGLAAYAVFGYILPGFVVPGISGAVPRALYIACSEVAGIFIAFKLTAKAWDTNANAFGLTVGFAVIPIIIMRGFTAMSKLAIVTSLNDTGYSALAESMPTENRAALDDMLTALANETTAQHMLIAAEYLCAFALIVGITRLIWYSFHGERREPNIMFVFAALLLRSLAEIFYQTPYSIVSECAYYVVSLAAFAASVLAAKFWDEPERFTERLSGKRL